MKTPLLKSSATAEAAFFSSSIPPRPEEEVAEEIRQIREAVSHEEIARRAHAIWEREGCPHGRDGEHWLEAERQLHEASALGGLTERGQAEVDARLQARAIKESAEKRARERAPR